MFNILKKLFNKPTRVMPESAKQAEKLLLEVVKNMSVPDLAKKINLMGKPNKWALTRRAAQGMQKSSHGGNTYQPGYTSKQRAEKIKRQIAKGIIQSNEAQVEEMFRLREERVAKQLAQHKKQGVVNEGKS